MNRQVTIFSLQLIVTLTAVTQVCDSYMAPPPNLGRPYEEPENQTMDALITGMLGGVDVASNMILADNGYILAELDMYLTESQFLGLYEPPKPADMVKMGMMPAPLGSPQASDDDYFFDFSEDYKGNGIRSKRKAAKDVRLRWKNSEMPYLFADGHFNGKESYMMRRSMTEWERYTCMKFRPVTESDTNSVRFQNGVGCNSQLGMVGGVQVLNLQAPGCRYKGLYLHEIGHALGLVHEHQLPNRDNYIDILYHNVAPHMRVWFNKYTSREVNQMSVPYEYSSVMHYGITAFAKDGSSQTIRAKDKSKEKTIGKVYLKELSYTDVQIVNKMYECATHCPDQNKCGRDGHLDENCNCICRDGSQDCDTTKSLPDRSCKNEYDSWSCYIWANQGECERNQKYMHSQCSKACGVCGSQETQTVGPCKDVHNKAKCRVWKERGDCVTNTRWMKINCKATCDLCNGEDSGPAVNCADSHPNHAMCRDAARRGECSVSPAAMFKDCRKSCRLCDVDDVDGGDGGGGGTGIACTNTHPTCERWAQSGECKNNPTWMLPNCRKACGKCEDGSCKNLYDDIQCEIWAQKLQCISNSEWMGTNCAKACGRGDCETGGGGGGGGGKVTVSPSTRRPTNPTTRRPVTNRPSTRRPTTSRPVVTTGTSSGCRNKHSSDTECEIWAKNDHCNINPGWMLLYCAKACGKCSTSGVTTTKSPTDPEPDGDCEDRDSGCADWAKHGFCNKNPRYNLVHCKKSCNNCNGCRDAEFLCNVWAKAGNCVRNPLYMLRHCQKSCKICKTPDPDSDSEAIERKPEENGAEDIGDGNSSRPLGGAIETLVLCFITFMLHNF